MIRESEHLLTCPYCQVKQIVQTWPFPFLIIPPKVENQEIYYIPYFRFKGLSFTIFPQGSKKTLTPSPVPATLGLQGVPADPAWQGKTIQSKIVDQSVLAINTPYLPFSLGFKAQTQPLLFFDQKRPGTFLAPASTPKKILYKVNQQLKNAGPNQSIQAHIGEIISLIYAPFIPDKGDKLKDEISGQVVCSLKNSSLASQPVLSKNSFKLKLLASLCPQCGWDLQGQTRGLIFSCANCHTNWYLESRRLIQLTVKVDPAFNPQKGLLLPFWSISFVLNACGQNGISHTLETHSDLIQHAHLPRLPTAQEQQTLPQVLIPGFKVQPEVFLRLAKQLTLSKSRPSLQPNPLPDKQTVPLTLPYNEASQALIPLLSYLAQGKKNMAPFLAQSRLQIRHMHLAYLYFQEENLDLIQPRTKTSFLKTILHWGEFI